MDSPKFNQTWNLDPVQMSGVGYSADAQALSELLAKNLRDLTINPNTKLYSLPPESSPEEPERGKKSQGPGLGLSQSLLDERRRGVRTLASVRRDRVRRMLQVIRHRTISLLRKTPEERKREIEERGRRFRCTCHYCVFHGDTSDLDIVSVRVENNEMEST